MMWGHGVPDDLTIPSLLSERFRLDGRPACVSNHGEWGATSRSALIELLRELRRPGRKPDVVVFYAGSYDVKEALFRAEGATGSEIDAAIRAGEDRLRREDWLFSGSALARLLRAASRLPAPRRLPAAAAEEAGREAVRVVAEVQRSVEALSSAYGFQSLFVWNPYVLAGERRRTPEEAAFVGELDLEFPDIAAAMRSAYRAARERRAPGFYDLSDVFATRPETLFIDAGHLTPAGNGLVADRLHEILISRPPAFASIP
jgi:lysophospholipase L1-like esterase